MDIAKRFHDEGTDHIIITPRRKGVELSADDLNPMTRDTVNPSSFEGWGPDQFHKFRIGDRIVNTKNDYTRSVMNGEMGWVRRVNNPQAKPAELRLYVQFDGRDDLSEYDISDLKMLRLAYVTTCHSAQGGQCDWAVVLVHSLHGRMLARQLLYTAVTRAKIGVILIGDKEGLHRAVINDRPAVRRTGLKPRLG